MWYAESATSLGCKVSEEGHHSTTAAKHERKSTALRWKIVWTFRPNASFSAYTHAWRPRPRSKSPRTPPIFVPAHTVKIRGFFLRPIYTTQFWDDKKETCQQRAAITPPAAPAFMQAALRFTMKMKGCYTSLYYHVSDRLPLDGGKRRAKVSQ